MGYKMIIFEEESIYQEKKCEEVQTLYPNVVFQQSYAGATLAMNKQTLPGMQGGVCP